VTQLTKDNQDLRVESGELMGRAKNNQRVVQEMRDERDIFKKMRDQVQSKFNEMMAKNERVERELNTKRRILEEYDEVKKGEIDLLNWKAEMQRNRITNLEMHVEDIRSEGMRVKEKYTAGVRKIEGLEIELIEEKARVKEMVAE
jgi:uncharacterized protein YigA (DUF484 family)